MRFDPIFLLLLPIFLFSVVVHEAAHGWVALRCGDPTARDLGRVTLNPLVHVDLIGSLLLPGLLWLVHSPLLLGWAKPVPVDHSRLRNPRNDSVKVAMAGPASNLLLALLFAAVVRIAGGSTPGAAPDGLTPGALVATLAFTGVVLNVSLAIFNLLPIPPLDGSWLLMRFLRLRHILVLHQFRVVGFIVIVAVMASPFMSNLLVGRPVRAVVGVCLGIFGVSMRGIES